MIIRKAYKFRLYPTEEQKILLAKSCGCVRVVWNKALELQKEKLDKKTKIFKIMHYPRRKRRSVVEISF